MKPPYAVLRKNYPRSETCEALFIEIGWPDLINNMAFWDTCAIQMSYGLRLSTLPFLSGGMRAKARKIKGARASKPRTPGSVLGRAWCRSFGQTTSMIASIPITNRTTR